MSSVEIQPIVVGTAGHIDHGKSSLVRALTGIDPDRLKEEKERGLTIDLGFARMDLPDGRKVGIVDVPGHERFIKNMVAGASGIDLVVLVVAADDGVMPQTREHLAIMQLLGVQRGFIALNKVDLVEPDMVELAEEDVRECVEGTFLESAPIVRVSAVRGKGLDEFRTTLVQLVEGTPPRSDDGIFRMPVQRVFSARGFGTILTGIPISGSLEIGDSVEIQPGGLRGKVRGIQAYHESATRARAGHSTALNLSDVDHKAVQRGHVVLTPGFFEARTMVAAELVAIEGAGRPITNRMRVRMHTGTAESVGEVVLLDQERLDPGVHGLVQLRLEHPIVCSPGDRFLLRLASPMITLGGGIVLEESEHRLKRFKERVIEKLVARRERLESPSELLEEHLRQSHEAWLPLDRLAVHTKRDTKEMRAMLEELAAAGRVRPLGSGGRWIHTDRLDRAVEEVRSTLELWFKKHPLRTRMDLRDLRAATGFESAFLAAVIEVARERELLLSQSGGSLRLVGHEPALDDETRRSSEACHERLRAAGFKPPTPTELAGELDLPLERLSSILELLVDQGEVVRVGGDLHVARESLEKARAAVIDNCQRNGQLEIPELRDQLGTTRKFLIPLLEHFDAEGLTLRQAGHRILRRR